ncbi:MAG: M2 family metallopeptidase [Proteobacteria bacterium]|nr:M2 family metallopeptidase [Pseudomonadota bacterium]
MSRSSQAARVRHGPRLAALPGVVLGVVLLAGCGQQRDSGSAASTKAPPAAAPAAAAARAKDGVGAGAGAGAETADAFIARVNHDLSDLATEAQAAGYTQDTYITTDTQLLNARATDRYLAYLSRAAKEARRYDGQQLSRETARAFMKLRLNVPAPAPDDAARRARLTQLQATLAAKYGEGKFCPDGPASCRNLDQLSQVLARSRDYDELTRAWKGWHDVGAGMRSDYTEFVGLANEGARELGFRDLGVMWRSGYDMTPEQFDATTERLWQQVRPLYAALHCYTRARLATRYGEQRVPAGKPIPAQLLGNMWAQQWNNIYGDILKPYPAASIETADAHLQQQKWDAARLARSAESFYTSLGFQKLPPTFWQRSMLSRPRDREVECHASAWDISGAGDVRVKACLRPTEEDLYTIYHELGHVYYFLSYTQLPYLFRDGANDGFHEAIGDTITLSMTPAYLARIGLISPVTPSHEALINQQMKKALDKIAFLPFGLLIDQWRWRVFSGAITPQNYNSSWWELSRRYQGIAPPVPRSESDFDPGAKYHIPGNTPYARYFLAVILQFQFHKALCAAAGYHGPLYECSNYGSTAAGRRFMDMLRQGASAPWQDTLERLTGTRDIDAGAIIEYFQPLMQWLQEQNRNQQCGWEGEQPTA